MINFLKKFSVSNFGSLAFPGQTLIEALAALAIISVVIIAMATSITTSLSNEEYNQDQTAAAQYAQQGTEIVQQIRDASYINFQSYSGTYCLAKNQTTLGSPQPNCTTVNVDKFIRSVQIQQGACATNVAQITVTVAFTDGKCNAGAYCHKQTDTSCLSVANPVKTP